MKTLIVYYSYTRSNETLAVRLQNKIGCDVLKIEETKKRTPFTILLDLVFRRKPDIRTSACDVREYDHVILIAPIWAAKIASPLVSFIAAEKGNIRRYSFITFCGGVDGQKEKIVKQLTALVGNPPAFVTELWLKNLPMTKEKRETIKWNEGYKMDDMDFRFYEPRIETFLNMSGVPHDKDDKILHAQGH